MPLYRLRRVECGVPGTAIEWQREWPVSELIEAVEGDEVLAVASARGLVEAGSLPGNVDLPLILKTTLRNASVVAEASEPPFSWMPRSRARFDESVARLVARGGCFWLWPTADGVLSDVPSTQSFLRAQGRGPLSIFFDPASLLTREMLPKAEDHLIRSFSALAGSAAAILLANIEPLGDVEGVQLAPLTRGVLSPKLLADLLTEFAPVETPVVLIDRDMAGQRAILGR